ncbi:pyridoxamine 5'-phosphate oxidase family protein [Streptomyces sp. LP11]|uniref:Pyridoxamine 5'-phosphate oxidase family protein n=1 Tax=Streptomyces pyxinicus TaxID=2970331 RepID=A0ABT2B3L5_9ACTN|nr:pyridoxamine 5'-phosphate oxidase family protein [Streptomyces sp. LP11]MCS0603111.1 pyridoxamine 5'-phosphate oxidase family protein [Streptomyces sp. LP11]
MTEQTTPRPAPEAVLGDLGRRLAARRARLGLTRRETALRAGMAPSYLRYLEEHPGAAPRPAVLVTLAQVLRTTVTELSGGTVDLPPGPARAGSAPRLTELGPAECQALLGTHGVGRLGVTTDDGPVIVPVNYTIVNGAIVFRTARGATPALAAGARVAFEVDRVDDAFGQGWSVLVRGPAHHVTDPAERAGYADRAHSGAWAGGPREEWVRIQPRVVTGRRVSL